MIQSLPKLMTLDDFLDWYPDGYGRFELRDGVAVQMQPTGTHERVAGEVAAVATIEIRRLQLPYFIPRQCIVKPVNTNEKLGYNPDVIVLDEKALLCEPLWKKRSTITRGETARLIVEVVSTNWQDYLTKLAEYEKLGVPEYWIVDYLGLGGRRYIGTPKQPTLSVYQLIEGEYQLSQFKGDDRIESAVFPELKLTAQEIFAVGQDSE